MDMRDVPFPLEKAVVLVAASGVEAKAPVKGFEFERGAKAAPKKRAPRTIF
jgi:hypothetical protein